MAWVKVPPENHPIFLAALPKDERVEMMRLFGGLAAKVNGNVFAGLFGLSAIVALSDADKAAALALEGAGLFDPMGNGRVMSDKVMLPASMMGKPGELRRWIGRAFKAAAKLPGKKAAKKAAKAPAKKAATTKAARAPAKKAAKRSRRLA